MPSPLFSAWVKNVYSLRVTTRTSGAQLSTHQYQLATFPLTPVQNTTFVRPITHNLAAYISTYKNHVFNQLKWWLYPQSTAPTMKTKKER